MRRTALLDLYFRWLGKALRVAGRPAGAGRCGCFLSAVRGAVGAASMVVLLASSIPASAVPITSFSAWWNSAQTGVFFPAPAFGFDERGGPYYYYVRDGWPPPGYVRLSNIQEFVLGQPVNGGVYSFTYLPAILATVYTQTFPIDLVDQDGIELDPVTISIALYHECLSITGPTSLTEGESLTFTIQPRMTGVWNVFLRSPGQFNIGGVFVSQPITITNLDTFTYTTPPLYRTNFRQSAVLDSSGQPIGPAFTGPMPTQLIASAGLGLSGIGAAGMSEVNISVSPVPEPSVLGLGLLGGLAIVACRMRRARMAGSR